MKKVIILGAGGHGRVVADIVRLCGDEVMGYLDDKAPEELPGFHVLGTMDDIGKWDCWYFAAVGSPEIRKSLMERPVSWYTAIHPAAVVAKDTEIGAGSVLMANAVLNPGAVIGKGCIVNTCASVDHDCQLGDFVHISPGAHVAGTVTIGNGTWIGVGASVIQCIQICGACMIGVGAVVVKDISQPGTYVGVPARKVNR